MPVRGNGGGKLEEAGRASNCNADPCVGEREGRKEGGRKKGGEEDRSYTAVHF